jgi:hypothetical protein
MSNFWFFLRTADSDEICEAGSHFLLSVSAVQKLKKNQYHMMPIGELLSSLLQQETIGHEIK